MDRESRPSRGGTATMANTYTNLLCHIVFSTQDRRPSLTRDLRPEHYAYMGGIVRNHDGVLLAIGGTADHVHLLARIPPSIALADMVRELKASSSKWLGERILFAWQRGYSAFSVSESSQAAVAEYIAGQETHHQDMPYDRELVRLLELHNVEFDPRFLLN
jgi:putative transposase